MHLDLNTFSTDPYYRRPAARQMIERTSTVRDVDTVVVPDLKVPAALDIYQRTLWVVPGLDRDVLAVLLRDAADSIEFGMAEASHFIRQAPKCVRRALGRNALTVEP